MVRHNIQLRSEQKKVTKKRAGLRRGIPERGPDRPAWRVLLVPDSIYWVTGTICREIARNNPRIVPTICSTRVLRNLLRGNDGILEQIDLVHFLDPWAPRLLLDRFHHLVPCISSIHHGGPRVVETNSATDLITVGSRQWFDHLTTHENVDPERVEILPYGVNTAQFWPVDASRRRRCRQRIGIEQEAFVLGFFAKASSDVGSRKGTDVMAAGLRLLKAGVPEVVALIVGPGWAPVVDELRSSGIDCRWIPYVTEYAKLVDVYHALDVYWVTARIEGGPLTLLEAMSCGICCVTTPVGLAPEVVDDGSNGYLVPIGDAEALVDSTRALARDEALRRRLGGAASATIRASRGWGQTTRDIPRLYLKAARRFSERTGKDGAPRGAPAQSFRVDRGDFPLNAIATSKRRRARMLEILYWLNSGDFDDDSPIARQLAWRACRANPWAREPWAHLLRIVHPGLYLRLSGLSG